ncbi:FtsX-like permease family protein [Natranaerovirga pectinivora]|uniref:FtsX-like permease family protein n=1 Tax=Natranaerovirga pectinivora TaxID=682400 RepID=A0A4V6NZU6_9FIRM|nr:ABC transporter permease [Natranaerovirga pectinivora]TCT16227.1 FtsX-like permease family protein [Natranaerovirga pectinivora]
MKFRSIVWKNFLFKKKDWMNIYFIASGLVCLFYILYNLSMNTVLIGELNNYSDFFMNTVLLIGALIIFVLSLLYIPYMGKLLILSRMREYGIYLVIGLKRSGVLGIFLFESIILFVASWITGILLGSLFGNLIIAVIKKVYVIEQKIAFVDISSPFISFILFGFVFVISTLFSFIYYSRKEPLEIIKGNRKPRKLFIENGYLGFIGLIIFLLMAYFIVYIVAYNRIPTWMSNLLESQKGMQLVIILILLILFLGLYLFISQSILLIIKLFFKIKVFYYNNLLHLREVRNHIVDNSMIIFLSVVVQLLVVIGIGMVIIQYNNIEQSTRSFEIYDFASAYSNEVKGFEQIYMEVLKEQKVKEIDAIQIEFITPVFTTEMPDIVIKMSQIVISEKEIVKLLEEPIAVNKGTYSVIHTFKNATMRKMPETIEIMNGVIPLEFKEGYSLDSKIINYMSRYHTGYLIILNDEDYRNIRINLREDRIGELYLSYFNNKKDSKKVADKVADILYEKYNVNNFQLAYRFDRYNENPYFIADYYSTYENSLFSTGAMIIVLYLLIFIFAIAFNSILYFRLILGKEILLKNYLQLKRIGITDIEMRLYIRQVLRPIFILPTVLSTVFVFILLIVVQNTHLSSLLVRDTYYYVWLVLIIQGCNLFLCYWCYFLAKKNYYRSLF